MLQSFEIQYLRGGRVLRAHPLSDSHSSLHEFRDLALGSLVGALKERPTPSCIYPDAVRILSMDGTEVCEVYAAARGDL
jgi:hypothetical protein